MTILEFLTNSNAEEIAERIVNGIDFSQVKAYGYSKLSRAFDVGSYFDEAEDCPHCRYLEEGNAYEDSWMNGICNLAYEDPETHPKCPYGIDRKLVLKRQFIEWLNSEID